MRTQWIAMVGLVAVVAGCSSSDDLDTENPFDGANAEDGGKADGIGSSSAVTKIIDASQTRFYAKLGSLSSTSLLGRLSAAAKRGVDVQIYYMSKTPGTPGTVLAEEGLEATGVDTTVERTDRLSGFFAVSDDTLYKSATSSVTTASDVDAAVEKFSAVVREADVPQHPDALAKEGVRLLQMPDATGAQIVALLNDASKSIDLEIYQLQDLPVLAALEAAQKRGVAVRVMLEPRTVGAANYAAVSKRLSDAGIAVIATPPAFDTHHNVDHAKFMILDGDELLFGSGNLVRSGLGGNPAQEFDNRDFWVRDRRAAAIAEAKQLFEADWARKSTTSVSFDHLLVTPDNADQKILELIDQANARLFVYNQSLSDAMIVSHLISAKKDRNVDVHVLLGMQPGFGGQPPKNQAAIDQLTAANIPATYLTRHYLHGKVVLSDHSAFIGSQNFTSGGLLINRELGEILTDGASVEAIARTFGEDEAHPAP